MRVLGISPFHDSSIAIVNDGEIEYFCKEERLTRKKRDRLPELAFEQAFKNRKGEIDIIVLSSPFFDDPWNHYFLKYIKKRFPSIPVIRMCEQHHLTHASLAFYNSGFDKALCMVIDRFGSNFNKRNGDYFEGVREGESIFIAEYPNKFNPIYKSYTQSHMGFNKDVLPLELMNEWGYQNKNNPTELLCESTVNITMVYEAATTRINQDILENGKTMGLAAYGEDREYPKFFNDKIANAHMFAHLNDDNGSVVFKKHYFDGVHEVTDLNYKPLADFAYQVQKQTQEQVLKIIKEKVEQTGIKKVCLTGGYGLNVVTNGYLTKNLPDVEFYFEPLADDTGNSIGAAMYVCRNETEDTTIKPLKHTFFNHKKHKLNIRGARKTTTKEVAELLSKGQIVAVYNGLAEGGPRALGNRSILFDPRRKDAKEIVNTVKKREWYRPFACSVLEEKAKEYFDMYHLEKSPFMTISFPIRENKKDIIPGVIHVDGSCRIQTVNENIPHYFNLLNEFNNITGVPLLLNTSFNMAGEALIETPEEAINTFEKTDLDCLWFPETDEILTK